MLAQGKARVRHDDYTFLRICSGWSTILQTAVARQFRGWASYDQAWRAGDIAENYNKSWICRAQFASSTGEYCEI